MNLSGLVYCRWFRGMRSKSSSNKSIYKKLISPSLKSLHDVRISISSVTHVASKPYSYIVFSTLRINLASIVCKNLEEEWFNVISLTYHGRVYHWQMTMFYVFPVTWVLHIRLGFLHKRCVVKPEGERSRGARESRVPLFLAAALGRKPYFRFVSILSTVHQRWQARGSCSLSNKKENAGWVGWLILHALLSGVSRSRHWELARTMAAKVMWSTQTSTSCCSRTC